MIDDHHLSPLHGLHHPQLTGTNPSVVVVVVCGGEDVVVVVCGRPSRRVIKVLDVFDSAGWTDGQRLDARRTCDGTCATVERGRRVARSRDAEGG